MIGGVKQGIYIKKKLGDYTGKLSTMAAAKIGEKTEGTEVVVSVPIFYGMGKSAYTFAPEAIQGGLDEAALSVQTAAQSAAGAAKSAVGEAASSIATKFSGITSGSNTASGGIGSLEMSNVANVGENGGGAASEGAMMSGDPESLLAGAAPATTGETATAALTATSATPSGAASTSLLAESGPPVIEGATQDIVGAASRQEAAEFTQSLSQNLAETAAENIASGAVSADAAGSGVLAGEAAGEAAGEEAAGLAGFEAADAGLAATGIGAPVAGFLAGAVALGVGIGELFGHHHHNPPAPVLPKPPPPMTNRYSLGTSVLPNVSSLSITPGTSVF